MNCHDTDAQVSRFSETGVEDSSFSSTPFMFGGNRQTQPQAIARQANGQIVVSLMLTALRLRAAWHGSIPAAIWIRRLPAAARS